MEQNLRIKTSLIIYNNDRLYLVFNHLSVRHIFDDAIELDLGLFVAGLLHTISD